MVHWLQRQKEVAVGLTQKAVTNLVSDLGVSDLRLSETVVGAIKVLVAKGGGAADAAFLLDLPNREMGPFVFC